MPSVFIYATGLEALPIGGFTGTIPSPTLGQLQADIRAGRFHLVWIATDTDPRLKWLATHCSQISPRFYSPACLPMPASCPLFDVGHDAGDVVRGTAVHSQRDQVRRGLVGVGHGEQDPRDRVGGHDHVQAVGAEQIAVAGAGLAELEVRPGGVVAGERPEQQQPLRVRGDLLGGDLPRPAATAPPCGPG